MTTTPKCLTGLLHPSSGRVRVPGHLPQGREAAFLRRLCLVMGQRNSLFRDLAAADAFSVHREIYRIPAQRYRTALDELVALLDLEPLLRKQIRVLSLGERMRCELAAALLHRPDVLFLDRADAGTGRERAGGGTHLRPRLHRPARRHGPADQQLHGRRDGRLRFDGDLAPLVAEHSPHRPVRVTLREAVPASAWAAYGEVPATDGAVVTVRVPRPDTCPRR